MKQRYKIFYFGIFVVFLFIKKNFNVGLTIHNLNMYVYMMIFTANNRFYILLVYKADPWLLPMLLLL